MLFKLQVQDDENDHRIWHDVLGAEGKALVFDDETKARKHLEQTYPVLYGLEKYQAGPKRTRVIRIYGTDQEEGDN